jgi:hypothetical protein
VRFTIEQRHLTDASGKPVVSTTSVSFLTVEAESADEAVRLIVKKDNAEVMGDIMKFPGFHAVATIKSSGGVFTLQVGPTSQSRMPVNHS